MPGERTQRTDIEMRADVRRFREQIEACVAAHIAIVPGPAWKFLEDIAADDGLWKFRSLSAELDDAASGELFFAILKGQYLSRTGAGRPDGSSHVSEHYADLIGCAEKLERSYAAAPSDYEPEKVRSLLQSLRFAKADLAQGAADAVDFFNEYVTTRSPKTEATETANFIATVGPAMQKAFGQPHDAEVAELTRVVIGKAVSQDQVRKARERHA